MPTDYHIQFIAKQDLDTILPFLQLLNPKTNSSVLQQRLDAMKETSYTCVGVYDHNTLIAVSGIWMLVKHYTGKHIEPDNLMVHPDYRGKGIGEQLMHWIHTFAKNNGCLASELNCYVANPRGHKFWMNLGYEIIGYHMKKIL